MLRRHSIVSCIYTHIQAKMSLDPLETQKNSHFFTTILLKRSCLHQDGKQGSARLREATFSKLGWWWKKGILAGKPSTSSLTGGKKTPPKQKIRGQRSAVAKLKKPLFATRSLPLSYAHARQLMKHLPHTQVISTEATLEMEQKGE